MYCSDDAEKLQLDNLLSFMLQELDFLGIIRSLLWICILSVRSGTVVTFYNHKLRLRYGCILMKYLPLLGLLE